MWFDARHEPAVTSPQAAMAEGGHHVGVIDPVSKGDLALEAAHDPGVVRVPLLEDLHRERLPLAGARGVNHADASFSDDPLDDEARDGRA